MTGKGINNFKGKDRRRMRLRNHIAKDLRTPKYQQRKSEGKKPKHEDESWKDWDVLSED